MQSAIGYIYLQCAEMCYTHHAEGEAATSWLPPYLVVCSHSKIPGLPLEKVGI